MRDGERRSAPAIAAAKAEGPKARWRAGKGPRTAGQVKLGMWVAVAWIVLSTINALTQSDATFQVIWCVLGVFWLGIAGQSAFRLRRMRAEQA